MHDEPFSYQRTEQLGIARRRRRRRKERKKIGERMVEEVIEGLEKSKDVGISVAKLTERRMSDRNKRLLCHPEFDAPTHFPR